jgi:hypothetical protein
VTTRLLLQCQLLFGLFERHERRFPASFEFRSDQAVIGIDLVVLTLRQGSLVAEPFQLLLLGSPGLLGSLGLALHGLLVYIQFNGRQGLKKRLDDEIVNGLGCDALANRDLILLAEEIALVFRAAFVLHHHFVATFAAVDNPVQQGCPSPGNATGLIAIILGVVIEQHGLDPFKVSQDI